MGTFTYHIKVAVGDKFDVTRDPSFDVLHVSQDDFVQFSSNDSRTVIRYKATSPFGEAEVAPHTIFQVGNDTKGPFRAVTADKPLRSHHFECGHIEGGKFVPWEVITQGSHAGDDTPVDP